MWEENTFSLASNIKGCPKMCKLFKEPERTNDQLTASYLCGFPHLVKALGKVFFCGFTKNGSGAGLMVS